MESKQLIASNIFKYELFKNPVNFFSIKGWAKVYGYNTIVIDDDPYAHGFQVI